MSASPQSNNSSACRRAADGLPAAEVNIAIQTLAGLAGELRRYGVGQAWLFGSRARGEASPRSDWDVLVEFSTTPDFSRFMSLKLLLEDRLGAPVDLLSRSACKPRFLEAILPELRHVA